jgi:hypothetical protein
VAVWVLVIQSRAYLGIILNFVEGLNAKVYMTLTMRTLHESPTKYVMEIVLGTLGHVENLHSALDNVFYWDREEVMVQIGA